jgi:hypothetical protein
MDRLTLFLRTSLFSLGGSDPHVPPGVMVVKGRSSDRGAGGVTLSVEEGLDEKGRALPTKPITLVIPWSKIDHVLVHDS